MDEMISAKIGKLLKVLSAWLSDRSGEWIISLRSLPYDKHYESKKERPQNIKQTIILGRNMNLNTIHRKTTFKLRIQDFHIGLLLYLDAINKTWEKRPGLSPRTPQLLT